MLNIHFYTIDSKNKACTLAHVHICIVALCTNHVINQKLFNHVLIYFKYHIFTIHQDNFYLSGEYVKIRHLIHAHLHSPVYMVVYIIRSRMKIVTFRIFLITKPVG